MPYKGWSQAKIPDIWSYWYLNWYRLLPDEGTQDNPKRANLEWIIIKSKDAFHISYRGDLITEALKEKVLKAIEYFLNA